MTPAAGPLCVSCSKELPATAQHCPYCGARQRTSTEPEFLARQDVERSGAFTPAPVTMADMPPVADATEVSVTAETRRSGPPVEHDAATRPVAPKPLADNQTASGETVAARAPSGTRPASAEEPHAERFPANAQMFSSYRAVRRLGEGGMGSVYLARDDVSGQEVAVKVLPATLAKEPDIRERFVQEAQALAQLDHPAIVPLVTFAREGNDHFLVMKFVKGRSLEDVIEDGGPLPIDLCRQVFRTIVDALGYAHSLGVIHRDIKPANVLLTDDNQVFLVDFGIAKRDKSARLTQTGMLMGTPQYMSPEQISGHVIDGRSDLYGAGLLLFEMLTGRPPFIGDKTFGILKQHVEAPVPDPRQLRTTDEIPHDLLVACEALLRKNPDHRPRNSTDVLQLLDDAVAQNTPSFGSLSPDGDGRRPTTPLTTPVEAQVFDFGAHLDHEAIAAAQSSGSRTALFVMFIGVAVVAVALWIIPDLMKQPPPPPPEPKVTVPAPAEQAFEMMLGQAAKLMSEGQPNSAITLIDTALAQQPDEPRALIFRAQALLAAKKRKSAEKVIAQLEARDDLPKELELVVASVRDEIERQKGKRKR